MATITIQPPTYVIYARREDSFLERLVSLDGWSEEIRKILASATDMPPEDQVALIMELIFPSIERGDVDLGDLNIEDVLKELLGDTYEEKLASYTKKEFQIGALLHASRAPIEGPLSHFQDELYDRVNHLVAGFNGLLATAQKIDEAGIKEEEERKKLEEHGRRYLL
jgi:hypothetical protein